MQLKNPICTTLFICLLLILIPLVSILVVNRIFNLQLLDIEGFYAQRNERNRIYQSDEIFDPDEAPEIEDLDPDDDPLSFDPDQQPLLNNQMNNVVLHKMKYDSRYSSTSRNPKKYYQS